jgi:predicted RecB family nuclease
MKSDLLLIPGIGKTFVQDFARIDIRCIKDLQGKNPEKLFKKLVDANTKVGHKTSKNYLYVLRLAVYVAGGGNEAAKLRWSAWKDV